MMQQSLFRHKRIDYALDEITIRRFDEKRREREAARRAALATARPQTIVLVSCGARKAKAPAPARELYASTLFKKTLAFAEGRADAVFILSAKHGLISPEQVIAPYNFKLTELKGKERGAWAGRVLFELRERVPKGSRVIILAGRTYRNPLEGMLVMEGFNVEVPARGKNIFELMSFLTPQGKETERRAA